VSKSRVARIGAFVGSVGVTAALVGFAASGTGAYFSDAKPDNQIKGTMGSVAIEGHDGGGANNLDITFTKMLPGEAQAKSLRFQNTGQNAEDVWVVFDQDKLGDGNATTGLNSTGQYSEVLIKSSGTKVFYSKNLNDRASTCPPGTGTPTCRPLPHMVKLQDSLAPGANGTMEFTFTPSARYKGNAGLPVLDLPYTLVATQHGIRPDDSLNSTVVN